MLNVGVNVQPQTVLPGEWERIRAAYPAGILAIIDWQASLAALPADANVTMWRFTQDPHSLPSWPNALVKRCNLAVFANEPDIEGGYPAWYAAACREWSISGGHVACPAFSDDRNYTIKGDDPYAGQYDVLTWHDYAGEFLNRTSIKEYGEEYGETFIGTEYAVPNHQGRCLLDLAAAGVTETVYLFAWRWQGNSSAGYDLAGVAMEQPTEPAATVVPTIYERQWRALNPAIALNPDAAIFKDWLRWRVTGTTRMGIPCSGEQPYPDGGDGAVCQIFTGAVAIWTPANGVEWR